MSILNENTAKEIRAATEELKKDNNESIWCKAGINYLNALINQNHYNLTDDDRKSIVSYVMNQYPKNASLKELSSTVESMVKCDSCKEWMESIVTTDSCLVKPDGRICFDCKDSL